MYGKILKTVAIAAGVVALNCVGWFAKPGERPEPRPFVSFRPPILTTNLTDVNTTFAGPQAIITIIPEPQAPPPQQSPPEPAITVEDVYEIVLTIFPLLAQIVTQVTQEAVTKANLQSLQETPRQHYSARRPRIPQYLALIVGMFVFWAIIFRDLVGLLSKITEYSYFAEAGMRDLTREYIRQSGLFANREDQLIGNYIAREDFGAAEARLDVVKRELAQARAPQQQQVFQVAGTAEDAVGGTPMVEAAGENEEESAREMRAIESREDVEEDASGPSEAAEEPRPAPLSPAKIEEKPQEGVEEVRTETAAGRSDAVEESSAREIPGAFSGSVEAGKREEKEEPQEGSEGASSPGVSSAFPEKNKDEEEVVEEAVPGKAPVVEGKEAEASWTLPAVSEVVEGPQAASSSAFLGERGVAGEKGEAEVLADVEGDEGEKQQEQHMEQGKGKEKAVEDADFIFKKIDYGAPIKRIGSRHKTVTTRRRRGQDSGQTESSTPLSSVAMFPHDPSTSRTFSFQPPNPAGRAGTFRPFPVVESAQHEEQPQQRLEAVDVAAGAGQTEVEEVERPRPGPFESMEIIDKDGNAECDEVEQQERLEHQQMEQQREREHEQLRLEQQQMEQQRLEQQQMEQQQMEQQQMEQQQMEQQQMEQQRLEQQQMEQLRLEHQQMEQQREREHEQLRLEQQQMEQQRLEQQQMEQQEMEQQQMEQLRLEQQQMEQLRLEQQQMEQLRLEQLQMEQQQMEQQQLQQQQMEQQRLEQLQMEQQQMEQLRQDQLRLEQHEPRAAIPGAYPEETGLADEDVEQDEQQQDRPPPMRPDYCIEGVDLSVSAGDAEILDCLFDEAANEVDQGEQVEDVVGGEDSQDVKDGENDKDHADNDHEDDNEDEQPNDQGEPQPIAVLIYATPDVSVPAEKVETPQPYTGPGRKILPARLRRDKGKQREDTAIETGVAGPSAGFSPRSETGFGFGSATDEPEAERPEGMDVDEGITGLADELDALDS